MVKVLQSSEQIEAGNQLLQDLQSKYLIVPAIEQISGDKMPNKMQIRYFNPSDTNGAKLLAKITLDSLGQNDSIIDIVKLNLKAKPGTLEVWFPKE